MIKPAAKLKFSRKCTPIWMVVLLAGTLCGAVFDSPALAQGLLDGTADALITPTDPSGFQVGARLAIFSREFKAADEILEVDAYRTVAELGYSIIPGLQIAGQVGWTSADTQEDEGETGPVWSLLGRANLFEIIMDSSAETGRRQWLGLELEGGYRHSTSNQASSDFDWGEVFVAPMLYYRVNRRGDALRATDRKTGLGVRGGILFNGIDGDLGGVSVEENRNFGFLLGADVRWRGGWHGQVRGEIYGSGDNTMEAGLAYYF